MIFADGLTFSYDYSNYLSYFYAIKELEWIFIFDSISITFPYVFIPGGGLFEIGFVVIVKFLLGVVEPDVAYALLSGLSVGFRTVLMRKFNLEWKWLLPVQMYAITLFEANALRAGLALTLTLWVLNLARKKHYIKIMSASLIAVSQHLQVLIFLMPFAAAANLPEKWIKSKLFAIVVFLVICVLVSESNKIFVGAEIVKLNDYLNQTSSAVGFNLTSVLSFVFVLCFMWSTQRNDLCKINRDEQIKNKISICVMYAAIPSLTLLMFGVQFSALSDRAWQFALVVLFSFSNYEIANAKYRGVKNLTSIGLIAIILINIIFRYPLSNFFSPPLRYEMISPLSMVR